jgi:phytoene synthase
MSCDAGSSFYAGFLLLSREKRRAMEALYSFMRHTDDLADNIKPGPAVAPIAPRHNALTAWQAALERAMRGEKLPLPTNLRSVPGEDRGEGRGAGREETDPTAGPLQTGMAILPALADTVRRFHIPHEHLYAVIEGVQMDLTRQRYETFDELRLYCERVASAVGLACIHVWGFCGPKAFEPARRAGIALQLTNILRDLKEDVALDRVYLPLADLRECDYSVDDLRAGVADQRFRRLMAMEVARAERFYAEGAELMDWLKPSGQRIFGLMMATYRALLRKIARRWAVVFHRRVRLSGPKRFQLLIRWSLLPPRKAALR